MIDTLRNNHDTLNRYSGRSYRESRLIFLNKTLSLRADQIALSSFLGVFRIENIFAAYNSSAYNSLSFFIFPPIHVRYLIVLFLIYNNSHPTNSILYPPNLGDPPPPQLKR